jgi:hypothetical protein
LIVNLSFFAQIQLARNQCTKAKLKHIMTLLLQVLEKMLQKSLDSDEYDEYTFASPEFVKTISYVVNNYRRYHELPNHIQRLLQPHGWVHDKFKEVFGVKDLLDDIIAYRAPEKWLFLHYEITSFQDKETGWKLVDTFKTLDAAFNTLKLVSPTQNHVTKIYYSVPSFNNGTTEFKGRRVFPSISTD